MLDLGIIRLSSSSWSSPLHMVPKPTPGDWRPCNAAQTFQHFVDEAFLRLDFVYAYIDDVMRATSSADEHLHHLECIFQCLFHYGIVINPAKCVFSVTSLDFLGHHVSAAGTSPLSSKVQAIAYFPAPTTICKLHDFLGLVNFYRCFISHCASILQPLTHYFPTNTQGQFSL